MLTYISLANIFPQYLSAASAPCNLNSPNTTGARVTDNYSHCGRHIPGNILQEYAESDRSQTSGVPAGPQEIILWSRLLKTRDAAMTGAAFHGVQPAPLENSLSLFARPRNIIVQTSVQNKSK